MTGRRHAVFTIDRLATPLGELRLIVDDAGRLRALDFDDYEPRMLRLLRQQEGIGAADLRTGPAPKPLRESLDAYFAGALSTIDALEVAMAGTGFQRRVWTALRTIPAGTTMSYGALAAQIGEPKAMRAVGWANGSNPIAIVVPCHRVIGANARLTGYGGGLARKKWLLQHEGAAFKEEPPARAAQLRLL